MGQIGPLVAVLVGFAVVIGGLVWLTSRARSRSFGSAFLGPLDEIFNPAAHRARIEIHQHAEHANPLPSADDKPC